MSIISMKLPVFPLLLTFAVHILALDSNPSDCVTNFDSSIDYFPQKVEPNNSQKWDIEYHNNYKILTNKIANGGNGETYLLYQCGTDPPSAEVNNGNHTVIAQVPLQDGVALTSTVQIPFLELMGLRTQIKTYIGDPEWISSPCVHQLISDGYLDTHDSTTAPSILNWTKAHPKRIVFDGTYQGFPNSPVVQDQTVLISEYDEASNKAIFEWLEFYSAFYNAEALANQIVNETAARYDCVANNADTLAQADEAVPVAVWGYYSDYPGYEGWNVATCDPVFNYYCEYAKACNVDLLTSDSVLTHDEFTSFAKDADVFFYVSSDWDEVYQNNSAWLDDFKSVKNKQVYDYQMSGPNAWFEERLAEYDVVLEDFCTVANRTTNVFQHQRRWFRNILNSEEIGSLPECTNVSAAFETGATSCIEVGEDGNLLYTTGVEGGDTKDTTDDTTGDTQSSTGSSAAEPPSGTSSPAAGKGWDVAVMLVSLSIMVYGC